MPDVTGIVALAVTAPVEGLYFVTKPRLELALAPMYTRLGTVLSARVMPPGTGGEFSANEMSVGTRVKFVSCQYILPVCMS